MFRAKILRERLEFEEHLRRGAIKALPPLVLAFLVFVLSSKGTVPEETVNFHRQLAVHLRLDDLPRLSDPTALISHLNNTFLTSLRRVPIVIDRALTGHLDDGYVMVGPTLAYETRGDRVDCFISAESYITSLSFMNVSAPVCFDRQRISEVCRQPLCGVETQFTDTTLYLHPGNFSINASDPSLSHFSLLSLFYSPLLDAFTVLHVNVQSDAAEYSIESYPSKASLQDNLGLFVSCLAVSLVTLVVDLFELVRHPQCKWCNTNSVLFRTLMVVTSIPSVLYFGLYCYYATDYELPGLPQVEWPMTELGRMASNDTNTTIITNFTKVVVTGMSLNSGRALLIIVLWLLVFRVVMIWSIHPRLAMLTSTIHIGWDHISHFLAVFGCLYLGFSVIYSFTSQDSVTHAALQLFVFLMGNFDTDKSGGFHDLFILAFGLVMYFTGLFLVLGLICSAYDGYRLALRASDHIVKPVLTDVWLLCVEASLGVNHRWPSRREALIWLDSHGCDTDTQSSNSGVEHMIKWYANTFKWEERVDVIDKGIETVRSELNHIFESSQSDLIDHELHRIEGHMHAIRRKLE